MYYRNLFFKAKDIDEAGTSLKRKAQ